MTIEQAQTAVDEWIRKTDAGYFSELTNMTLLTEEVGELARIMARKYGDQSFKGEEARQDLGDELADVLWVVLCLANQTNINLSSALLANFQKKNKPGHWPS